MNTTLEAEKTKTRKGFHLLSGVMVRRDQETNKPNTKGKSYGSGKNEPSKNKMKEYLTGRQPKGKSKQDDYNPKTSAELKGGFGTMGMRLTRTL